MKGGEKMKTTAGTHQIHPLQPVWAPDSRILILGSFPSVESRESGFYYGHPQNRFWTVIASVLGMPKPENVEEKVSLLKKGKIALWDVIRECEIRGSSDLSIKNAAANDIDALLKKTDVKAVFTNGKKAFALYNKLVLPDTGIRAVCLPSTSPAYAVKSADKLIEEWKELILPYLSAAEGSDL